MRGVSFSYARAEGDPVPAASAPLVLDHAGLSVPAGAFALLVGGTGSGKTTLLRLCKPEIRPEGELSGTVRVLGRDVRGLAPRESAGLVGYVFQSPDSQIVCDS
ncbi:MAG: ATP-binding cassette domain-containing protein, partial [Olsenella umbonata]|nr:ATP-binding cassette domain-containing protein [Parafannyhessea umbonata]